MIDRGDLETARSMMRCSWAVAVLGVRRAVGLGSRSGLDRTAASALDRVAASAESELDEIGRNLYRTGERLQDGMIDLAWEAVDPARPWSPTAWMKRTGHWMERWMGGGRPSG